MDQRYPLPELPGLPPSAMSSEEHMVIRVFLVNGESRSLHLDDRADVNVSEGVPRTLTFTMNVHTYTHAHTACTRTVYNWYL